MMQVGGVAKFTTSSLALGDISDVIYDQLCSMDRTFAKTVSRTMLEYYSTELYYMRLCQIELANGNGDAEVRMMAEAASAGKWIIPGLLSEYLNCIGNFQDSTGMVAEHEELVMPDPAIYNGIGGYFGRVDADTHAHYENRTCPGVIAQRICEDLRYTIDRNNDRNWDLPAEIAPLEEDAGRPTANLLGWAPSTILTSEQREGLTACGIGVDEDVNIFPKSRVFNYNYDLMEYIDRRINELSGRFKCVLGASTNYHGSMCQQDYTRVIEDENVTPQNTDKVGKNSTKIEGFAKIDVRQNMFSQAMKFRFYKEGIMNKDSELIDTWCCYEFNNYTDVPDEWSATKNLYFDHGGREVWNTGRFSSAGTCGKQLLKRMCDQNLISTPKVVDK